MGHSGTHRLEMYQAVELGSRNRETKIAKNEKRKKLLYAHFSRYRPGLEESEPAN